MCGRKWEPASGRRSDGWVHLDDPHLTWQATKSYLASHQELLLQRTAGPYVGQPDLTAKSASCSERTAELTSIRCPDPTSVVGFFNFEILRVRRLCAIFAVANENDMKPNAPVRLRAIAGPPGGTDPVHSRSGCGTGSRAAGLLDSARRRQAGASPA